MDLRGKVALITGGGTGVGRAAALELARRGCSSVVNYSRSQDEAERTAAEAERLGVRCYAIQANVAHDQEVRQLVAQTMERLGRLDVLICSAGTTRFIPAPALDDVTDEVWDEILHVNVKGVFQTARAARPAMLESGGGEIVTISSVAGILASGSSIPYCASKAAVINLTIALARLFAPRIRVNSIAPGFISGRWLESGLGEDYEKIKQAFDSALPLGRVCTPEDVAAAILGIVSGSGMITGQTIVCDSGMTITGFSASLGQN